MENNNNNTYPSNYSDSNTSTPRCSREVECETASYDQEQNNPNYYYKVKLMCSYGGKILPRPHDNQLTYIGGDTKILTVDRNITYASILNKLNSLSDSSSSSSSSSSPSSDHICFKYQLPGEDLDALISVTNDEDLEHMMTEYGRIFRSSLKPVRLRLFMFPLSPSAFGGSGESKTGQDWFVDALNGVQISSTQGSSPASENPDFLFGFDKGNASASKVQQDVTAVVVQPTELGSECGSEDSNSNRQQQQQQQQTDPIEIQKQMQQHESQRIQIAEQQTPINIDPRTAAYYGDYYAQKIQPPPTATGQMRYWQEQQRHMTIGGYPMSVAGTDSPVYLVPSAATGIYPPSPAVRAMPPGQMLRQASAQGQAFFGGMQQRMPEIYREQQPQPPVYGTMTQPKVVATYQEPIGMVTSRPQPELGGYGVDAMGRQVYYTSSNFSQGGMAPTSYQPLVAAAATTASPALTLTQEGKMVVNPNKAP
ncbi:uncharacterized protein [Rutidosis leptorrhynchoides]|uniref:uncharacterized protein n=1 Tax=Rutidosis leptorrhynchoides TaxID=125765 RepID=UPI003A995C09